ncbi:MAG TPA: MFS transporter [Vicinamibacterales bacterium]|nr:MFS transporter [Vicinamibacterales bacterium]
MGYAGYYLCRSNLSVAAPLIAADAGLAGITNASIGAIASAGVLAYAIGKPITGVAGDMFGGRPMFLLGMWGTVVATIAFGLGAWGWALTAAWVVNRFIQSAGWGALTKLVAQWFAPQRHGRIIAVLSLSYLFGDAAARVALGALLDAGRGWRAVFFAAAGIMAVMAVAVGVILRERPRDRGLPEPESSPLTVYGSDGRDAEPAGIASLIRPLLSSTIFWLVCLLSCALTLVREAFNIWIPTYLTVAYGMAPGEAARWSALFPLMGGVSVLAVGVVTDRLGPGRRMVVAAPLLLLAGLLAWSAASDLVMSDERLGLVAVGGIALLLIGPYSLLAGAIALELGGKRGAATAAGLIDTAGYTGALLSGIAVGAVADAWGWGASLRLLGAVTVAASVVAAMLAWAERRPIMTVAHAVPPSP